MKPVDQDKMFAVKSDKITITIDNTDEDSVTVTDINLEVEEQEEPKKDKSNKKESDGDSIHRKHGGTSRRAQDDDFAFTKKTFSTGFYESERQEIVTAYKSVGAKRDEYRAASIRNIERELKKSAPCFSNQFFFFIFW